MWRRILAFMVMAAVLPMMAARAFWGAASSNADVALFGAVFIAVYIIYLPLYRRLFHSAERRWWKELLCLLWLYPAVIGAGALIIILF